MLGRTRRHQTAELRERNAWLESRVRQLNLALGATRNESGQHFRRCERFSDDLVAQEKQLTAVRIQNATMVFREDNWAQEAVGYAERLGRALRGCARYREEITVLRSQVAALQELVGRLQLLVGQDEAPADRAVEPARPTPEIDRLMRLLRLRDETIRGQDERLAAYQLASEAADWQQPVIAAT